MIIIIDYHCGNPASIRNMLKKIGRPAEISSDPSIIKEATKLILPGVGSFDHGMQKLEEFNLLPVLQKRVVKDGVPILGICLGVQLFCLQSDEGSLAGLGWIDADVKKFDSLKLEKSDKVPHMGWAETRITRENKLIEPNDECPRYYYVHSYHLECRKPEQVIAHATHGYEFVTAVEKENIVGVQFHPEKSHRFGMSLLNNFVTNY